VKFDSSLLDFSYSVAGAIFGAGFMYATMRERLRKQGSDLNGLGKKYSRVVALLIRWADTDVKRNQIADLVEPQ
jgi:hypothetical protein